MARQVKKVAKTIAERGLGKEERRREKQRRRRRGRRGRKGRRGRRG